MATKKVDDSEFKIQAVKLGREIGFSKLKEENDFLAEASAFFAASRRKSAKT